ncbi:4'-phosphopantetheinyl transferase superfamily protein [Cesiribacter sp. SM1]|uniref:4'-phosphopantetheinyl transferase family protein n=1 Tax=Cesiribacter sp. SM1 TaxID=2861196 RepID=UPI001CD7FDA4|nr:hypothetical protein [Cesiribacter sp. SM1]
MLKQRLVLPESEVHLWYFQTSQFPDITMQKALQYLDEGEAQRYQRFRCSLKRRQFLTARVLLKHLLTWYLGEQPEKIQLRYTQLQKPYLEGDLAFNISHSGQHLVIAISRHRVGVDIQEEASIKRNHLLVGLSAQEQQLVTLHEIFPFWVLKEAFWKADNQLSSLTKLLTALALRQPQEHNSFSLLVDSWCVTYLKLFQNLHLAWVVEDPQPVCRFNGVLLKPV